MNKRKKYGIIFAIMVFIVVFIITFMLSVEVNIVYEKINENRYVIETVKQIQPFDYNTGGNIVVWFAGAFIMFISLYMAFVKAKEKDINKAQMIVLAIIFPIILFAAVGLLDISISDGAWFLIIVVLLIIAIFEYDLFGNKIIISFFDFKLIIKMIILFIILIFITVLLSEVIPPFTKTTISPITKDQYEKHKGEKFDWNQLYLKDNKYDKYLKDNKYDKYLKDNKYDKYLKDNKYDKYLKD